MNEKKIEEVDELKDIMMKREFEHIQFMYKEKCALVSRAVHNAKEIQAMKFKLKNEHLRNIQNLRNKVVDETKKISGM